MKYDVIIVGAGTAGALAAKTTAKAGLSTLIVENKEREQVGNKVCGDVVGEHHFKVLGITNPNNGAFRNRVKGIKVFSPDEDTIFTVANQDFMGFMLHRQKFGQWLLDDAIEAGAEIMDQTMFMEPVIKDGAVKGIVARQRSGRKLTLESKVVVDASGYFGVVRNKLPESFGIEGKLDNEDVEICYREVRQLEAPIEDEEYCQIILNQKNTPGGYTWVFPLDGAQINVGLGLHMHANYQSPKEVFYNHIAKKPYFENSTILKQGGGFDPTRRPIDKLVGNGVVLTGDAASLVNPVHGGGIGPSMKSGYFAGNAIIEALEKGEATEENLWSYPGEFMKDYGKKQASLDVFRRFLIATDDQDLNYGMKYQLLTQEDIYMAGMGEEFDSNITDTARRVFRGISKLHFLKKLSLTVKMMKDLRAHYDTYPETPADFAAWQQKTVRFIDEARIALQN